MINCLIDEYMAWGQELLSWPGAKSCFRSLGPGARGQGQGPGLWARGQGSGARGQKSSKIAIEIVLSRLCYWNRAIEIVIEIEFEFGSRLLDR